MPQSNFVHLEGCDVLKMTGNAMLIRYEDEKLWLPLSQVSDPDVLEEGDRDVTVSITEWIARQKGIEINEDKQ